MARKTPMADPLGPKEVAEFLEVKRATVQQWTFRNVLPDGDYTINNMPAWERRTIVEWAVDTGRLEPDDERVTKMLSAREIAVLVKIREARRTTVRA